MPENSTPIFLPSGDRALVMQFGDTIDAAVNARLICFAEHIGRQAWPGITEIVPTYRSLLICYDPGIVRGAALQERLSELWQGADKTGEVPGRHWLVPCLYGGEVGLDLEDMAREKGLTTQELIALHSGAEYRVYMIGFAPGFAYLGGLPEALHTPRLRTPRQYIPAGGIGIGGAQASVNSVAGPSGWRFIGSTPWQNFDPMRAEPFLFRAGDRIRFRAVDAEEARDIAQAIKTGTQEPQPREEGGA